MAILSTLSTISWVLGDEIAKNVKCLKKVGLEFGGFERKAYFCAAFPKKSMYFV